MESKKRKLKALSDIASIDITLEFSDILKNVLEITCETMEAHSGTIMLVDEKDYELKLVASYGLPDDYIERVYEAAKNAGLPITSSPSGTVLKTGKQYIVPNVFEEPADKPWKHLAEELGFSSQIFTPMKRGLKVIGLLNVYKAKVHEFTEEESNFVTIAASQAASVVQNARLCSRLQKNILELEEYEGHLEEKIKKTHKKLCYSEKYLRTVIESSLDGIGVMDEVGRFEFGNNAFFNITGWQKEELIGQFFMKLFPEDAQEFIKKRWEELQKGIAAPCETTVKTKNGGIKYIYTSCSQTEVDGRKKYVGIIKDITEKKRLEQELIESEIKYRDLFEKADDPMYTLDTGGYLQTINNAGLKALGCTKGDVIGSHISKWLTQESLRVSMELLQKQLSGDNQFEQPPTLEIICKNGDHRLAEIRTRVIREGDRITGVHGIARDVTEKRRLEQKIRDYHETLKKSCEDLIEADRIKTEFISNITHELLTPLTSIRGFTELLYDETTGKINDDQKKSLQIILRNSDRLIRLIKDLLDVSHLEKDKFGMRFGLISIEDIISRCIQDLQPQAKYKEITIIRNINMLPRIWGDEGRLTQVITNLLANAIKFTPQKGTITVTAKENHNEVKISITDTGIGIPHDQLSRIFERFYQIDGSNSRKYGGAGLGLSICKSIVESHYGSIWAESDGNGSTFHIVLPKLECIKKNGL
ncbi:PAS domain S-box protein [Candidatus Methanoperedens nitratireducens]|uniref:histidine kinase n=1 Tax=Candidatus Methanoperedens nitratireducens TaxID=1392998 RepID=A0A284VQY6_9EURY|nr:PAS domain S-box protein [Candidatus Methanoperedens nitroreducens]SNQ61682.1 putative Histidine kinase [Candidatus Methanoperedens nitroreducens]